MTSGVYPPIPSHYSKELSNVIKLMLQKNPANRPSTEKLLNSSLLNRKAAELNIEKNSTINVELLKTIRVPKKIHYLTDRLPKSNYEGIESSLGLVRDRRLTENTPEARERQSNNHMLLRYIAQAGRNCTVQ